MPRSRGSRARGWSRCGAATIATATAASAFASSLEDADGLTRARAHAARRRRALSRPDADLPRGEPHAARGLRSRSASQRKPTISGRGCGTRAGRSTSFRCAAISSRRRSGSRARRSTRSCSVEGDGVHEIPVGPGARRHHRAGSFPLPGRRRESAAPRGAARLRAQGHREALRGDAARRRRTARRPRVGRQHRRLRVGVRAGGRMRSRTSRRRRAPRGCARCASSASASPIIWATSALSATTAASRSVSRSSRASRRTCCARTSRRSAIGC